MAQDIQLKRIYRDLTPEERARFQQNAAQAEADNTPEARAQTQQMLTAANEPTFSGALRRAFHGCIRAPGILPHALMKQARIEWSELKPFLLGNAPLTSDQIDRLADALGMELVHQDQATSIDGD
jgi:hypothetical protein